MLPLWAAFFASRGCADALVLQVLGLPMVPNAGVVGGMQFGRAGCWRGHPALFELPVPKLVQSPGWWGQLRGYTALPLHGGLW